MNKKKKDEQKKEKQSCAVTVKTGGKRIKYLT